MQADRSQIDKFIEGLERTAYERGCADTRAKFERILRDIQNRIAPLLAEAAIADAVSGMTVEDILPTQREPRAGSDQARVLDAIRQSPGQRGVDVIKSLQGSVEERTARTALHRLKKKGSIYQMDGKWFPVEPPKLQRASPKADPQWRRGRVVYCGGLIIRWGRPSESSPVGSNPTASAQIPAESRQHPLVQRHNRRCRCR